MRRFLFIVFAFAFAGGASALPLLSKGASLLGYKESVLPVGVCLSLHCQYIGTYSVSTGYKGYIYDTDGGSLTVYRDQGGAIRGGILARDAHYKAPFDFTMKKFIRGFAGANWTPQHQQQCSRGATYTGRTIEGSSFQVKCVSGEGGVEIQSLDTRMSARDLRMLEDGAQTYWSRREQTPAAQTQVQPAPAPKDPGARYTTGGPWVGCLSADTETQVIRYATRYDHDLALAFINGRIDDGDCRMFKSGSPIHLHASTSIFLIKVTDSSGVTYWLPREALARP